MTSSPKKNISNLFSEGVEAVKPFKNNKIKRAIYKYLFPKEKREAIAVEAKHNLALRTAKNWRLLINEYFSGNLESFIISPKKNLETEKIIWQYWGQGMTTQDLPEVVKLSFQSVNKYKGDYRVIHLDDQNISEYLDLPDFVLEKKGKNNFRLVFFSDLLRVSLLRAYGGIWIDATILLTDEIPKSILSKDFFVFQRNPSTKNKQEWYDFDPSYFCWDSTHLVNILSSFMVAKKDSYIMELWSDLLLHYWKTQDSIYHYFFFQILFEELMVNDLYPLRGEIIDDTLPHILQKKAHEPYSAEEFSHIKKLSSIHKLTYIKKRTPGSFYDYLIETHLEDTV